MKLSELFLNRFLYRDNAQSLETKDSAFLSLDSTPEEPAAIPSGGAAQDINTGNVTIDGSQLTPGTIPQTTLDVSNWGWGQTCAFSSTDLDTVSWGSGVFTSAGGETYAISAGNTGNMSAKNYIYLDLNVSDTVYQKTTTPADAVGIGKVLIAVAQNAAVSATFALSEATQIVGDNIIANTINASKLNVGQLSAITADFGTMTSGTIIGATIKTSSSGERVEISNDEVRSYDSSGVLRAQLSGTSLFFNNSSGDDVGYVIGTGSIIGVLASQINGSATLGGAGTGGASLTISGNTFFTASGAADENITYKDIRPITNNSIECGTSSYKWYNVESMRFTLNGTTITSWPSAGTTTLSGLSIDTNKSWGGYEITNCGGVQLSGVGDVFDCNSGYIDNARAFYFETGRSTNPSISGEIRYYDSGTKGFRGYVNGFRGQFDLTAV
jgi:hypothetical protein